MSRIPSPSRSQGAPITPRHARTRRTLSTASPARSDASGRLSSVVEKFIKNDKFTMSPMKRRSVLPDNTEIEAPRRASWWRRLEGSSRDVLEALDTNKMPADLLVEEYEFEVEKGEEKQTASESSDYESVASIVVPQRKLFKQKKQTQNKFGDMGSRKSLGRTNIEDMSIDDAPKNLFNKGPRNRPVFPAALLNSTNKTINKTVEPEPSNPSRPNLFGQAGTKRKNMFTDFVLSESEEDSEVQPQVFDFKKYDNKRISLETRNRRMPSLTPSMTSEIAYDWNLLPSSTMIDNDIGAPEVSRINIGKDMEEVPNENQDNTLTDDNASLKSQAVNNTKNKSITGSDENNKTLTNENVSKVQGIKENNISKQLKKTHNYSKTRLHDSIKETISQNTSPKQTKTEGEGIFEKIPIEQKQDNNHCPTENGTSIEDQLSELHSKSTANDENQQKTLINNQHQDRLSDAKDVNTSKRDIIMRDLSVKDKSEQEMESSPEDQDKQDYSKEASDRNQDYYMENISGKEKSNEEIVESSQVHESLNSSKEMSNEDIDEKMEEMIWDDNDDEKESDHEESDKNADTELNHDVGQNHNGEENSENENHCEKEHAGVGKNVVNESQKIIKSSVDADQMEEENDIVDERPSNSTHDTTGRNRKKEETEIKSPDHNELGGVDKNVMNQSQKIVESSVADDQMEEENDIVDEMPSNSTHDTTGRNRKKEETEIKSPDQNEHGGVDKNVMNQSQKIVESSVDENRKNAVTEIKSPEAVLQNITKDNESFRPIGRSTTFRKSKSVVENIDIRPSLAPLQDSTLGSEGSRNSSTEGSGWDSHRTTRKTLRQTFGKEFTARKSLRALVWNHVHVHEASEYEQLEQEISEPEEVDHENSNEEDIEHDDSIQVQEEANSEPDDETEAGTVESEHEAESDHDEDSQQEEEPESEQEVVEEENESESNQEEYQEIEAESEQDESQQQIEIEAAQEESEREEDIDMSHENAQSEPESAHDISESEIHSDQGEKNQEDSEHIVSELNSQYNSNRTERVVFDNEISEEEIDYEVSERVSRQITYSEQVSERGPTPEVTRSKVSEHSRVHDVSIGTKKSMLLIQTQKIVQENMEIRQKTREKVQNSLKLSHNFNFNDISPLQTKSHVTRINKTEPKKSKPKLILKSIIPMEALPKEFLDDMQYKPPKKFQPANAPWITKRLYKFLETKLEPKYHYRARIRAEELVQSIYSFTKLVRRRDVAPQNAVDELKREMARLHIVNTHFEFYDFFREFMPREIRIKVNPEEVNKIPIPRNGMFSDILPARVAVE